MSLTTGKKRVFVCPLNWGLGHATRCIPVINELLAQNAEVIIGADKGPYDLLKLEFPGLEFIRFPGYEIGYSKYLPLSLKMMVSLPGLLKSIRQEHLALQDIISKHKINAVISDNRYGLWNKEIPCVFITHQLFPIVPFFENRIHKMIRTFIKGYTKCWIPDNKREPNLSGMLSHKKALALNIDFIGLLSRFVNHRSDKPRANKYDLFVIISGPEPQRSIFQNKIFEELKDTSLKAMIVTGEPNKKEAYALTDSIKVVSHLLTSDFHDALCTSEVILSRSGYSTIMDIATLGKKVIFVPTPGQTEQEYLAKHLSSKNMAVVQSQDSMNVSKALNNIRAIQPLQVKSTEGLRKSVSSFLKSVNQ